MKKINNEEELSKFLKKLKSDYFDYYVDDSDTFEMYIDRPWKSGDTTHKLVICTGFESQNDVKLYVSEISEKQFVLQLLEPAHKFVRPNVYIAPGVVSSEKIQVEGWRWISLPEGSKLTSYEKVGGDVSNYYSYTFDVPKQDAYFLIGIDEEYPFISRLPKPANTVSSAHKVLRPKGLKPDAIRQGEFFFNPVGPKIASKLDLHVAGDPVDYIYAGVELEKTDINNDRLVSDHIIYGFMVDNFDNKTYVQGYVTNERHYTLILKEWHEVIVNNEIPGPDDANYD